VKKLILEMYFLLHSRYWKRAAKVIADDTIAKDHETICPDVLKPLVTRWWILSLRIADLIGKLSGR